MSPTPLRPASRGVWMPARVSSPLPAARIRKKWKPLWRPRVKHSNRSHADLLAQHPGNNHTYMTSTALPDALGHFGPYGGRFAPEVLMAPLEELEHAYQAASQDPGFHAELDDLQRHYSGRPTPLYFAK